MTLGEIIARAPSPQDLFLRLVAGRDAAGVYDMAAQGRAALPFEPSRPDRSAHAMGAELMADRLGGDLTRSLGVTKEAVQGLTQLLRGERFVGEHGFDPGDIEANERGILAAGRPGMGGRLIDLLGGVR